MSASTWTHNQTLYLYNVWHFEAAFPLRKTFAVRPYGCIKSLLDAGRCLCFTGGRDGTARRACRAHTAYAALFGSQTSLSKEHRMEKSTGEQDRSFLPSNPFQTILCRLGLPTAAPKIWAEPGTALAGRPVTSRVRPAHICHRFCLQARQQMLAARVAELRHPASKYKHFPTEDKFWVPKGAPSWLPAFLSPAPSPKPKIAIHTYTSLKNNSSKIYIYILNKQTNETPNKQKTNHTQTGRHHSTATALSFLSILEILRRLITFKPSITNCRIKWTSRCLDTWNMISWCKAAEFGVHPEPQRQRICCPKHAPATQQPESVVTTLHRHHYIKKHWSLYL